ncbi:LacI family DNA-binding transcriptional regulator [Streptomyces sp. NPDC058142]|uniref:LacI family DNA-binding transcriptional regulator n=1 Tax=Streptomyces sp. NPDC058142 TaxID=3346355 RepID=UPI0036E345D7
MARAAGVSTATVSRTLSGLTVRPELARRVRTAAQTLDYQPNRAARELVSGRCCTVGVVVPDLANPYFSNVLKAVTVNALESGFRTIVVDADGDPDAEPELCRTLLRQTDGVVVVSPRMPAAELRALADPAHKLVLVNRVVSGAALPTVTVDAFGAMFGLCGHLAGLGHRRIVYLAGPADAWQNAERRRAVEQARAFGLAAVAVEAGATLEAGEAAVD